MRHGTCFRRRLSARHAGAAPHSAVAELGVVRRRYALTLMDEIREQLLAECQRITESSMWNVPDPKTPDDIITSEEREAVAQEYFRAAQAALDYIASDSDEALAEADLVLRAVRYLGNHAIPPMRDRTAWFTEGLLLLVQIACPHTSSIQGGEPFFADLRRGMDLSDQWAREHFLPK